MTNMKTQKENFDSIINFANNFRNGNEDWVDEIVAFCEDRKEKLEKKYSNKSNKVNEEHEILKDAIYNGLLGSAIPMTIPQIVKEIDACNGLSTNKISAMLTKLIADGKIERTEVKGIKHYSIV